MNNLEKNILLAEMAFQFMQRIRSELSTDLQRELMTAATSTIADIGALQGDMQLAANYDSVVQFLATALGQESSETAISIRNATLRIADIFAKGGRLMGAEQFSAVVPDLANTPQGKEALRKTDSPFAKFMLEASL